jgi:hypothetical protein
MLYLTKERKENKMCDHEGGSSLSGPFKELDLIIQDHCLMGDPHGEDNILDDNKYDILKDEIARHINGELPFEKLSYEAQEIMEQWEHEEMLNNKIPPLDQ